METNSDRGGVTKSVTQLDGGAGECGKVEKAETQK